MLRIVSDTSTLYSTAEAREAGFAVSPLSVTIAGKSYREFDEISPDQFVDIIHQGNLPTSSQPSVGDVAALYEEFAGDEILNIAMADGLSGTYASAKAADEMQDHAENLTVINSRTLCGPHRYLVEKAVKLAAEGMSKDALVAHLNELMETGKSYLMPADFAYLRRGGRLSPLVSYVGQATNMAPIMTQTPDGRQLSLAGVRRSFVHAIKYVIKALQDRGVGEGWRIYVTHAGVPAKAQQAVEMLKAVFPASVIESYCLSPAFITQGGPGCVAVQIIKA